MSPVLTKVSRNGTAMASNAATAGAAGVSYAIMLTQIAEEMIATDAILLPKAGQSPRPAAFMAFGNSAKVFPMPIPPTIGTDSGISGIERNAFAGGERLHGERTERRRQVFAAHHGRLRGQLVCDGAFAADIAARADSAERGNPRRRDFHRRWHGFSWRSGQHVAGRQVSC